MPCSSVCSPAVLRCIQVANASIQALNGGSIEARLPDPKKRPRLSYTATFCEIEMHFTFCNALQLT